MKPDTGPDARPGRMPPLARAEIYSEGDTATHEAGLGGVPRLRREPSSGGL